MAAPTTIHFVDTSVRPTRTRSPEHEHRATGAESEQGIVFSRTVSTGRASNLNRSRSRDFSRSRSRMEDDEEDVEAAGTANGLDHRVKQVFRGKKLFFLAYQSIGVIYGDIGTSPLYVFSSTFTAPPQRDDLIGVLSLIIWSLLIMVTLKYIIIILHADNEGEGGTFSCYSLLSRYANIANIDPKEKHGHHIQRHLTNDLSPVSRGIRGMIERSNFAKGLLKLIGVYAVSMVMSDGVLTPAQSVLGAVQGLNVATNVDNSVVVGTTCGILVLLFMIQPFGTTKIAVFFAPVIIIWLLLNGGIGVYNLAMHDWRVLKAFNPGYAFMFLIRNKEEGWRRLGGVLLAFTGVEALFADLGAFSMRAIQMSWLGLCLPLLLLTYTGQAAYIADVPSAYAYPVFYTAPKHMLIPMIVFAVLAAIVASQAIITATFQLLAQITKLSYFPQIKVVHTSKVYHNQLYVPLVNWLLMIGTIIITAVYRNTTSLGNAYGVCVMFVTFFDTCMVSLVALIVWKFRWYYVVIPALAFACFDASFLSSSLTKVPDGAWFTLTLATVLAMVFILWRFGKEQQWTAESKDRLPPSKFIRQDYEGNYRLVQYDDELLGFNRGFGIFFDKVGDMTPIVFSQFMAKLVTVPEVMVFFHMRAVETPTVDPAERYVVERFDLPNCYRIIARHGYMDEVITPDLASIVHEQIKSYLLVKIARRRSNAVAADPTVSSQDDDQKPDDESGNVQRDGSIELANVNKPTISPAATEIPPCESSSLSDSLALVERAYQHRVLYVVGKEEMHVQDDAPLWRRVLLSTFLFVRYNTRNKMANLKVPTDRLVEIGFVKDI